VNQLIANFIEIYIVSMNDSCFKGAYVVKNVLDIYSEVADMAYCLGSDRGCEYFDTNELLYGGTGIISKDGILKPAGFAFEFLHRLYSYFVGSGDNYLISTDCHDSYGIVCHNQRVLGYNYYFTKEDEIERDHLWKYFEDRDVLNLNLELEDMTNGEYQIKIYRINQSSGSVLDIWEDMEFESDLSRGDVKYFQRACEPKMVIQKAQVTQNLLKLEVSMQPNEIAFIRIRLLVS
jgi:beta-xylosidase